jgi:hypothetical protein
VQFRRAGGGGVHLFSDGRQWLPQLCTTPPPHTPCTVSVGTAVPPPPHMCMVARAAAPVEGLSRERRGRPPTASLKGVGSKVREVELRPGCIQPTSCCDAHQLPCKAVPYAVSRWHTAVALLRLSPISCAAAPLRKWTKGEEKSLFIIDYGCNHRSLSMCGWAFGCLVCCRVALGSASTSHLPPAGAHTTSPLSRPPLPPHHVLQASGSGRHTPGLTLSFHNGGFIADGRFGGACPASHPGAVWCALTRGNARDVRH